ncbi:LOW QUALITY PROTEIN: hypothetical protein U9M48_036613, partial [Paspalum notatum var. saurae]
MSIDPSTNSATSTALHSSTLHSNNQPSVVVHPYATISVQSHVPVTLQMKNSNYSKWASYFKSMCGKFGLEPHIDGTLAARPTDPQWDQADCCVRSWLFGSIDDSVLDHAMTDDDQTARDLWVAIEHLFRANKEPRAIFLSHEFHSLQQGDQSITDYYQKMKTVADALRDVGHAVSPSQLVLNLLHGVNPRFSNTADNIANADPLPDFAKSRDMLLLKELRLANADKVAAGTALVTDGSVPSSCTSPGGCRSTTSGPAQGTTGGTGGRPTDAKRPNNSGKRWGKGKGKGGSGGSSNQGGYPNQPQPTGPWICINPSLLQYGAGSGGAGGWRSTAPGLLGPPPQAQTAFAPLQASTAPQTWDQAGLIAALNQLSFQNPGPWVLDSGATSHMSSSDGILHSRLPPSHSFITDLKTRRMILRCNSSGDLYTIPAATAVPHSSLDVTSTLWHHRLGHPGASVINTLRNNSSIACNKVRHNLTNFVAYAATQFNLPIKAIQADNGREFVNHALEGFLASAGIQLRLSCPYTSQQNGKAERSLLTLNNICRTILIHAHMPPSYWVEALATTTYVLNRRPCSAIGNAIPYERLFGHSLDYSILRVFGCLCYPNLTSTTPHKLAPRSTACVFLGYPSSHKGYRCLDLSSRRIIISCHVVFDESDTTSVAPPSGVEQPQVTSTLDDPAIVLQGPVVPSGTPPSAAPIQAGVPAAAAADPVATAAATRAGAPPAAASSRARAPPAAAAPQAGAVPAPLPAAPPAAPAGHFGQVYARRPQPAQPDAPAPPGRFGIVYGRRPPPAHVHAPIPVRRSTASVSTLRPPEPPQRPMQGAPSPTTLQRITRSQAGSLKPPIVRMNLSATHHVVSPVPSNYRSALADPTWHAAMAEEYQALIDNNTWRLVPRTPGANVVMSKWIFKHKFHSDGTLARHKARWVVRGFSQQHGIDYDETFSPVVKPATIRVVLSIAVSRDWPIHQLDVKNAFLHGYLEETVYCQEPPGFVDPATPNHVCLLQKSLYGLKQAPRAWYQRFASYMRSVGFVASASDTSLFVYKKGGDLAYLLLYVDDIILTAFSSTACHGSLHSEFAMTDLGNLHHFLGISVMRSSDGLFLSQRQYALDLLQRAGMAECHSTATPVDTRAKLSATDGSPVADPSEYRSLAGALQYLTLTRPDLAYAVQQACLFMHDPRESHLALIKRILRYVKGTLSTGLHLSKSSPRSLTAYSNADWAGCPDSRRSTLGYCVFLGDNLTTVSRSSAEAEYRAVAHAVAESCWLRQLLQELHVSIASATVVYCDNVSAVYLAGNPVHHRRTKHIEIDIHFVREKVALGQVRVLHVPSSHQFADIMTKGLPVQLFTEFRSSLCVCDPPAATAS